MALEIKPPDKKQTRARWPAAAIIILALLALLFGCVALWHYKDYKAASDSYRTLENAHTRIDLEHAGGWPQPGDAAADDGPVDIDGRVIGVAGIDFPDLGIDHAELYAINPDYMGWIWIDDLISGIHISYPFLQGETNDEYLKKDIDKERSSAGSVFADCNTPADFSEHHTILYGHNMLDGSMFSDLKKYLGTAEDQQERYFYIFLRDGSVLKCRLFSAHVVSKNSTVYQIDMSDKLYAEFFPRVLGESDDDWGCSGLVPGSIPEKAVTLSTCHGQSGTSRRMAVHAYVDTWFVDPGAIVPETPDDAGAADVQDAGAGGPEGGGQDG